MKILVNKTTFKMLIYFYVALFSLKQITLSDNVIAWNALCMITDSKIFQAGPETANYGRFDGEFNTIFSNNSWGIFRP